MKQKIIKLNKGKFQISWEKIQGSEITLDFNPLIKHFQLEGIYCLLHWQARPRNLRRWGIYDAVCDQYYGLDYDAVKINACEIKLLQIDESKTLFPPTAVLWLNGKLNYRGERDVTVDS
ncbi:hypothetical protein VKI21_06865 [Cyanobacterium aponinum UTEX 3222]|uniref:hypothetical protein n=1 Tax=Cyanobacterium aponinum TaxID=379064 RepID=UPI002B4BBAB9|nr:hypothetical protein [Cyanobacterium aponinum]WRL37063.1 hypothetical protein VKI22_10515 [Cyanobacterium aponinum UTEX 3221]WRL43398.1 hypothetical protein VKI21_06865 [Cyanobacterium aponinum UTEX 3222]